MSLEGESKGGAAWLLMTARQSSWPLTPAHPWRWALCWPSLTPPGALVQVLNSPGLIPGMFCPPPLNHQSRVWDPRDGSRLVDL